LREWEKLTQKETETAFDFLNLLLLLFDVYKFKHE
jgi:hypothetical protein